jgi:hypothetical protein
MLARAWPEADLRVIEDEGHGGPLASEALAGAVAQWVAGWRASRR